MDTRPEPFAIRLDLATPTHRMKRAFKYDVAITAADFDALAVNELKRRLEQRLSKAVSAPCRSDRRPGTPQRPRPSRKAIEKDARVVVVLFQRLWSDGDAPSAADAAAVKARIGKVKRKDVLIIPIDTSPVPSWLKGTIVRASGARPGAR